MGHREIPGVIQLGAGHMGQRHLDEWRRLRIPIQQIIDPARGYDPGITTPLAGRIVSIATPDDLHAEQLISALDNGADVFCEKPLAFDDATLDRIERALARHPERKVHCHLPLVHTAGYERLRDLVSDTGTPEGCVGLYHYGRRSKLESGWRASIPNYSLTVGGGIHVLHMMESLLGGTVEPEGITVIRSSELLSTGKPEFIDAEFKIAAQDCELLVDGSTEAEHYSSLLVEYPKFCTQERFSKVDKLKASMGEFLTALRDGGPTNVTGAISANRSALMIDWKVTP